MSKERFPPEEALTFGTDGDRVKGAEQNTVEMFIPENVERDLKEGLERVTKIFFNEDGTIKKEHPRDILVLETSGRLPLFAQAKIFRETDPKNKLGLEIKPINLARRAFDRIPNHISPRFYENLMVDEDVREKLYRKQVEQAILWLKDDENEIPLIIQRAIEGIKSLDEDGTLEAVLVLDDTVQLGGTSEVLMPILAHIALDTKVDYEPTTKVGKIVKEVIDEQNKTQRTVKIETQAYFENPNWLHDIVKENFIDVYFPDEEKAAELDFEAERLYPDFVYEGLISYLAQISRGYYRDWDKKLTLKDPKNRQYEFDIRKIESKRDLEIIKEDVAKGILQGNRITTEGYNVEMIVDIFDNLLNEMNMGDNEQIKISTALTNSLQQV